MSTFDSVTPTRRPAAAVLLLALTSLLPKFAAAQPKPSGPCEGSAPSAVMQTGMHYEDNAKGKALYEPTTYTKESPGKLVQQLKEGNPYAADELARRKDKSALPGMQCILADPGKNAGDVMVLTAKVVGAYGSAEGVLVLLNGYAQNMTKLYAIDPMDVQGRSTQRVTSTVIAEQLQSPPNLAAIANLPATQETAAAACAFHNASLHRHNGDPEFPGLTDPIEKVLQKELSNTQKYKAVDFHACRAN